MLRLFTAILVMFAATVMGGGNAYASPVTPAAGYGFSAGSWMLGLAPDELDRELDAVAATQASWLRVLIDWSKVEPRPGEYDWSTVDRIVGAAQARNLQIVGNIAFTPAWARPPMSLFTAPPVDSTAYGTFVAAVVERYGSRISNWEMWNEPNLPLFFGFAGDPVQRATKYTTLLQAAYPVVKRAQPGGTVIAAGLSRSLGGDAPPAFLTTMYDAGAKGNFDAMAMHPYVFPGGLAADPENGWSDVPRVYDVMAAHGDGDKRIWFTEFGAPTSAPFAEGVSQEDQARQITDILWAISQLSYAGPAFIYSIRDVDSNAQGNREANFGALLTSDWQPKFAAQVLAR